MGLISSIFPDNMQCGDSPTAAVLSVRGSGFIGTDKINYDGADIGSTVVVSATEMQMTLNPSLATQPRYVPIKVTGDTTIRRFNWTPGPVPGKLAWYPAAP